MEINEKQFIAGFNSGYLLAEHQTALITALLNGVQTTNSYISGMSFGQKEYELKKSKSYLNELSHLRYINKDDMDRERKK